MKKTVLDFLRRGLMTCGLGPIILAALYLILNQQGHIDALDANQVSVGIFSLTVLAFIAGGINVIYQIERLPLMLSILIHGGVLYVSYLATYLLNDWLERGPVPISVFTIIFVVGYLLIWGIIYSIIKRNTEKVNEVLRRNRENV